MLMRETATRRLARNAFTLVELVVTTALIATIATAVYLSVQGKSSSAKASATAVSIRMIKDAANDCRLVTGSWPAEVTAGVTPSELVDYFPSQFFRRPVPLGGVWDWVGSGSKASIGIAIQFDPDQLDMAALQQLDKILDDGVLESGDGVLVRTKSSIVYTFTISDD
ncbi:MAG: prepilin-type N-terminal cleavage/methylation domain-containing protein [Planctomycetes bacterium]|nr:prepilin-type N-terminal cleavage/methylation domain-containing protein [Planctomycetota bacterium]